MESIAEWLVEFVNSVGYPGIFIAMLAGNVFVPIPVEVIMIPAGYLINQGEMHLWAVLAVAIAGDICGSLISYYLAFHFGRRFIYNFGKYIFFTHERMELLDRFFASHGEISVLTGRLTPGLRHFMAFPAGLAHMHLKKFCAYTGLGGGLWAAVLLLVGYEIGGNKDLLKHYMPYISTAGVLAVMVMVGIYVRHHRRNKDKGQSNEA